MDNLIGFSSWRDVLDYAKTGAPLYYKAPMDHRATRLRPLGDGEPFPPCYEVRARTIKIWPSGSVGRGRNRTADPFTADAGHLGRFQRPDEAGGVAEDRPTDNVHRYRGASIELSGFGRRWQATVRHRGQEISLEAASEDGALDAGKAYVDGTHLRGGENVQEAPRNAPADQHAADELVLYIENTSDLSPDGPRGQGHDVLLNALRKWKKGTYDPELAVKLFGYLAESGAKRYAKEMGSGEPWSVMFTTATRKEAARQLEQGFRSSAENGEYDHVDTGGRGQVIREDGSREKSSAEGEWVPTLMKRDRTARGYILGGWYCWKSPYGPADTSKHFDSRSAAKAECDRRNAARSHATRESPRDRMDPFTRAYFETALWSSTDNADDSGGEPLDANYSTSDISDETRDKMIADCADFQERFADQIGSESEQAGHDFWLTRNGHGAGFWDGDWPEPAATELTEGAKSYGEFNLYVGDDGEIYGS